MALSQKTFIRIESPITVTVILDTTDHGSILPGEGAMVIRGLTPGVYPAIFRFDSLELRDNIVIDDQNERILYVDINKGVIEDRSPVNRTSKQAILTYRHPFIVYDSILDKRDKRVYRVVKIGDQTWFAENLGYKTPTGSSVYPRDPIHEKVYGRLYTWDAALIACPEGWHLSSDEDWMELEHTLGMSDILQNGRGWRRPAGASSLKSAIGWFFPSVSKDEAGFSSLPGGYCNDEGYYYNEGFFAYYWTSTSINGSDAWYRVLTYDINEIGKFSFSKKFRFSVRCVKNNTVPHHEALP